MHRGRPPAYIQSHTDLGRHIQGVRATKTNTDRQTHAYSKKHAEAYSGREGGIYWRSHSNTHTE